MSRRGVSSPSTIEDGEIAYLAQVALRQVAAPAKTSLSWVLRPTTDATHRITANPQASQAEESPAPSNAAAPQPHAAAPRSLGQWVLNSVLLNRAACDDEGTAPTQPQPFYAPDCTAPVPVTPRSVLALLRTGVTVAEVVEGANSRRAENSETALAASLSPQPSVHDVFVAEWRAVCAACPSADDFAAAIHATAEALTSSGDATRSAAIASPRHRAQAARHVAASRERVAATVRRRIEQAAALRRERLEAEARLLHTDVRDATGALVIAKVRTTSPVRALAASPSPAATACDDVSAFDTAPSPALRHVAHVEAQRAATAATNATRLARADGVLARVRSDQAAFGAAVLERETRRAIEADSRRTEHQRATSATHRAALEAGESRTAALRQRNREVTALLVERQELERQEWEREAAASRRAAFARRASPVDNRRATSAERAATEHVAAQDLARADAKRAQLLEVRAASALERSATRAERRAARQASATRRREAYAAYREQGLAHEMAQREAASESRKAALSAAVASTRAEGVQRAQQRRQEAGHRHKVSQFRAASALSLAAVTRRAADADAAVLAAAQAQARAEREALQRAQGSMMRQLEVDEGMARRDNVATAHKQIETVRKTLRSFA